MVNSMRRGHLGHYYHTVTLRALMHSLTSHRKIIIVFTGTKCLAAALINLQTTHYNKMKDAHTWPCIYFKISMLSKVLQTQLILSLTYYLKCIKEVKCNMLCTHKQGFIAVLYSTFTYTVKMCTLQVNHCIFKKISDSISDSETDLCTKVNRSAFIRCIFFQVLIQLHGTSFTLLL